PPSLPPSFPPSPPFLLFPRSFALCAQARFWRMRH
ncbi:Hypothetical protein NocV09_05900160, partial [Nannochloropsis oceanica]